MITGSTGGFGEAFARKFAASGCKLILTSRKPEKLDKLAAALKVPAHKIIVDLRDRKATEDAFKAIPKEFQDIDLLINNAGGAFGMEPAQEALLDDWQNMMEANDLSLIVCTHLVLSGHGRSASKGISSISARSPAVTPIRAAVSIARPRRSSSSSACALRADLISTNVRVTNIEPGMAETRIFPQPLQGRRRKSREDLSGRSCA